MVSAVKVLVDEIDELEQNINTSTDNQIQINKQTLPKYLGIIIGIIMLLEAILMGMLFFVSPSLAQPTINNNPVPQDVYPIDSEKIITLINTERDQHKLKKLKTNDKLTSAAKQKAADIITAQHFAHSSISGDVFSSWIKAQNYKYLRVGENLAIHFKTESSAVNAWLDSPKHRLNILNPYYLETGVAVINGNYLGENTTIIVQLFGQPLAD